jgi:hypothetical protein
VAPHLVRKIRVGLQDVRLDLVTHLLALRLGGFVEEHVVAEYERAQPQRRSIEVEVDVPVVRDVEGNRLAQVARRHVLCDGKPGDRAEVLHGLHGEVIVDERIQAHRVVDRVDPVVDEGPRVDAVTPAEEPGPDRGQLVLREDELRVLAIVELVGYRRGLGVDVSRRTGHNDRQQRK